MCTKFDSSSFSIPEIWLEPFKFKMGHVTYPRPFQGLFVVRMLRVAMTDLCTKFKIPTLTHYKDMNGNEKCKNWGGLGVMGQPR